jgi:hypothetical protein
MSFRSRTVLFLLSGSPHCRSPIDFSTPLLSALLFPCHPIILVSATLLAFIKPRCLDRLQLSIFCLVHHTVDCPSIFPAHVLSVLLFPRHSIMLDSGSVLSDVRPCRSTHSQFFLLSGLPCCQSPIHFPTPVISALLFPCHQIVFDSASVLTDAKPCHSDHLEFCYLCLIHRSVHRLFTFWYSLPCTMLLPYHQVIVDSTSVFADVEACRTQHF